jgi:hypothetical protein
MFPKEAEDRPHLRSLRYVNAPAIHHHQHDQRALDDLAVVRVDAEEASRTTQWRTLVCERRHREPLNPARQSFLAQALPGGAALGP